MDFKSRKVYFKKKAAISAAKDELSTNEPTWKQISNLNDQVNNFQL